MQSISKQLLVEHLELILEKANLVIERNISIKSYNGFLTSPTRKEKYDAACMLIQVIGETAKKVDDWTSSNLLSFYPQVYWKGIFGLRNIISHEYGNVDPEQIFQIIRKHLPELIICINTVISDIRSDKYNYLFKE